jgi:hypothetical protein
LKLGFAGFIGFGECWFWVGKTLWWKALDFIGYNKIIN